MRGFLFFACIFAIHFFSEQQGLCSQGLARSAGLSYGNFVKHLFHHLNVSQVESSLVNDMTDCAITCLGVVTCFSYNVAAQPNIDNRILCELLASDKYNFSEKFQANPHFHHYAIHNKCSEGPCVNGGRCIALYSHGDFKCKCLFGFKGKKCEKDIDECYENKDNCDVNAACKNTEGSFDCTCNNGYQGDGVQCSDLRLSDSKILRGHSDYEAKLSEYLAPVQVSGKQWMLCFRASEHQYRAAAFHTACDNKGPTVTLIRVGIYVFGGYTDKSWGGGSGHYISSNAAFLFSLKNHVNQQYKMLGDVSPQHATYSKNGYGPTFGGGHDLYVSDSCNANTGSHTNLGYTYRAPNGYVHGTSDTQALLAGSFSFKCDEYEVFYQV